nr:hypothetical protein [Angustibacter aerolatus]
MRSRREQHRDPGGRRRRAVRRTLDGRLLAAPVRPRRARRHPRLDRAGALGRADRLAAGGRHQEARRRAQPQAGSRSRAPTAWCATAWRATSSGRRSS